MEEETFKDKSKVVKSAKNKVQRYLSKFTPELVKQEDLEDYKDRLAKIRELCEEFESLSAELIDDLDEENDIDKQRITNLSKDEKDTVSSVLENESKVKDKVAEFRKSNSKRSYLKQQLCWTLACK